MSMKLSFDTINKNFEKLNEAKNLFPQIKQYENREIGWDEIRSLSLCEVANLNTTFNKIKDLDLVLGKKSVTFEDLKPLLKKYSRKLYKKGKEIADDDWQEPDDEVRQLKRIKNELKDISKEKFDSYFRSQDKYEMIFPYLWRIEKSLNDYLLCEIFNYLVTQQVEVFEGIEDVYDYEYLLGDIKFDTDKALKMRDKVKVSDNCVDKIKQMIQSHIEKDDIDLEYLKNKLNKVIQKL